MNKLLATVLLIAVVVASGTTWAQNGHTGDAVEQTSSGLINWTSGVVYATGIGAPPAKAANAAQARAMAERAAFVVALRNLLETVKGVRVDSETLVENFMVKSDVIRTRVDGIVKGARSVSTSYMSDGSVEIQVAMPLKGALMDALVPENFGRPAGMPAPQKPAISPQQPSKPAVPAPAPAKPAPPSKPEPQKPIPTAPLPAVPEKKPEQPKPSVPPLAAVPEQKPEPQKHEVPQKQPEPSKQAALSEGEPTAQFKGGVATGLVIDGRGLGLRPALLPKILDSQGREIYVGQVATRTNAVEQGVAGYAKDVNAAANNFRVTDNPAVIKGLRASGSARTDIVVGQADARVLQQLGGRGDFLQYCRVIIVY
jgi:hypothetical protein